MTSKRQSPRILTKSKNSLEPLLSMMV